MKILVLPKAYSLAEIGRSLRRQVTPSTLPPPCQWGLRGKGRLGVKVTYSLVCRVAWSSHQVTSYRQVFNEKLLNYEPKQLWTKKARSHQFLLDSWFVGRLLVFGLKLFQAIVFRKLFWFIALIDGQKIGTWWQQHYNMTVILVKRHKFLVGCKLPNWNSMG